MNNWKCCLLGDILTLQRGHDLTYRQTKNGDIPVVGSNGIIAYHDTPTTKAPCVTIGRSGNIGHAFYYDCDCWAHNTVLYVKDFKGTHPKFAYYLLKSMSFGQYNAGSAVPTLNRNHIHSIEIKYPPLPVQKKIASILSSLDDKIELNTRMNNVLEEIARALFRRWFVAFEFPDNEGKPYKSAGGKMVESEMGSVPEGWNVRKLNDISKEIICGKTPSTKILEYYGNSTPFITIPDMHNQVYAISTERYLSINGVQSQPKKTIPKNSICVSCIATPGLVCLTAKNSQTNQQINSIVCKDEISPYFIYFSMLNISEFICTLGSSGSTTSNLNKGQFSKIKLIIPSCEIMKEFDKITSPIFKQIKGNQIESQMLTEVRDTLLPKLMSGEIEV